MFSGMKTLAPPLSSAPLAATTTRRRLTAAAAALLLATGAAVGTTGTATASVSSVAREATEAGGADGDTESSSITGSLPEYAGVSQAEASVTAGSFSEVEGKPGALYLDPEKTTRTLILSALAAGGLYTTWPDIRNFAADYGITLPERPALP